MFLKNVRLVRLTSWFVLLVFDQFDLTTLSEKLVFFLFSCIHTGLCANLLGDHIAWSTIHRKLWSSMIILLVLLCQLLVFPWWERFDPTFWLLARMKFPSTVFRLHGSSLNGLQWAICQVQTVPSIRHISSPRKFLEGRNQRNKQKTAFFATKGLNCWRNTLLVVSYF